MGLEKNIKNKISGLISEIHKRACASGKHSFFCIGTTMNVYNEAYFFSSIREGDFYVCGNIMISDVHNLREIVGIIDGQVNEIMIDVEKKKSSCIKMDDIIRQCVKKSTVGYFRGNVVAASSFEHLFTNYCRSKAIVFTGRSVCLIGAGHLGIKIAEILVEYGMDVYVYDSNRDRTKKVVESVNTMVARGCNGCIHYICMKDIVKKKYLVIIGATNGIPVITVEMIKSLDTDGFLIDAGLRTLTEPAVCKAIQKDIPVLCLISKPGFDGMMFSHFGYRKIVDAIKKRTVDEGFSLVSGGMIGEHGDVIVDNAITPKSIIGIAKGNGLVLTGKEKERFNDRISLVVDKYIEGKRK